MVILDRRVWRGQARQTLSRRILLGPFATDGTTTMSVISELGHPNPIHAAPDPHGQTLQPPAIAPPGPANDPSARRGGDWTAGEHGGESICAHTALPNSRCHLCQFALPSLQSTLLCHLRTWLCCRSSSYPRRTNLVWLPWPHTHWLPPHLADPLFSRRPTRPAPRAGTGSESWARDSAPSRPPSHRISPIAFRLRCLITSPGCDGDWQHQAASKPRAGPVGRPCKAHTHAATARRAASDPADPASDPLPTRPASDPLPASVFRLPTRFRPGRPAASSTAATRRRVELGGPLRLLTREPAGPTLLGSAASQRRRTRIASGGAPHRRPQSPRANRAGSHFRRAATTAGPPGRRAAAAAAASQQRNASPMHLALTGGNRNRAQLQVWSLRCRIFGDADSGRLESSSPGRRR
jgi:hypothetical protein